MATVGLRCRVSACKNSLHTKFRPNPLGITIAEISRSTPAATNVLARISVE
jgi:hypothetical protein